MTRSSVKLKGITWNHTRGYVPMVATAQRFSELYPHVEISWQKRSLQEFGDFPINRLAEEFDLLVIDHPFIGFAAARGSLLPLEEYLPSSFLSDQSCHAVGKSHASYSFDGHHWALAIDAAAPVSSCRRDLLQQIGIASPETWEELIDLARRGTVALPAVPVDCLMNFYMLCVAVGNDLFASGDQVVSKEAGVQALDMLRELLGHCAVECFSRNPIAIYEAMSSGDPIAYCPFAFGYSNYSRAGYAKHLLQFGDMVRCGKKGKLSSTLGGTGLAISTRCQNRKEAVEYASFVAHSECQRTLYFESGGQPGHRLAWENAEVNQASAGFFERTLPALDRAHLRPRYNGYLDFQNGASPVVQHYLQYGGNPAAVVDQLNRLYRDSRRESTQR